jgi:hypothetical protein
LGLVVDKLSCHLVNKHAAYHAMKTSAKFLPLLLWLATTLMPISTSAAERVTLDFSVSDNLKMVYDAGLRPWRVTLSGCAIEETSLQIVLPQSRPFLLDVSFGDFDVYADYSFSVVGFATKRMSVDDAVAKVREIAQAVGINTAGLIEMAEQEKKAPGSSKDGGWRGYAERENPRVSVAMVTYPQYGGGVNALVILDLNWETAGIPPKMFTKPMTPPPGYENVSMAKPPGDPNRKPLISVQEMQRLEDLRLKMIAASDMPPEMKAEYLRGQKTPNGALLTPAGQAAVAVAAPRSIRLWVIGVAALLLVAVALALRLRRK